MLRQSPHLRPGLAAESLLSISTAPVDLINEGDLSPRASELLASIMTSPSDHRLLSALQSPTPSRERRRSKSRNGAVPAAATARLRYCSYYSA